MSPPPAPAAPQRVAQNTAGRPLEAATATDAAAVPAPTTNIGACDKPGGMGLSRVVEIDTTGGPGFGFEHFKQYDFLRPNEVVLTFDDGPWPVNTPAVLKALADDCLKATFFEIGEHAIWHPEIAKQVAVAGNTIGSHTWSHKDLARNPYASDIEQAKQEIEMGVSAVHAAVGGPIAPFFRFPALQHPPELLSYLAERNIASFSTDLDSFDFKMHKPQQVIELGGEEATEARQRYHPNARLPACHRRGAAGNHPSAQGGRLQGSTRGATLASDDHPEVRRNGDAAGQAVSEQRAAPLKRSAHYWPVGCPTTGLDPEKTVRRAARA